MKKNKFSKALKHLKSKKIDDKIKSLEEAAPTNNMSGVYQVTPSTGDAFRLGVGDPDKKFYPKADGTWPAGIPADPSDTVYIRKGGYYDSGKGVIPTNQVPVSRDFSYDDVTANGATSTDTFIRPSDGKPYTSLPEGTESFILGPLVGNYAINHGYDDFTNIGYIQKDTRQFVLLASIQGFFKGEDRNSGNARTWDGTSNQATIYNSNFTLEHLLWMQDRYNKGDFADNFPFNFSGGVPVERHPSDPSMGSGPIFGIRDARFGGNNDNIGTPQVAPAGRPGFGPGELRLWNMNYDRIVPKPKRKQYRTYRTYRSALRNYERTKTVAQQSASDKAAMETPPEKDPFSPEFPPSPPDKFPVDPPPEPPPEPDPIPDPDPNYPGNYPDRGGKIHDPSGLDSRAIELGYNDELYPVNPNRYYTTQIELTQEILSARMDYAFYSAAANGTSPNYDTAEINQAKAMLAKARKEADNWERWKQKTGYTWRGSIKDDSFERERRQAELDKDKEIENELEKLEKDKAEAEAAAEAHAAEARALIAKFGIDVAITLFGGAILGLAGKALGRLPAVAKFFKLSKAAQKTQIDDALRGQSSKIPGLFKNAKNVSADDVLSGLKKKVEHGTGWDDLHRLFQRHEPLSTSVKGGRTTIKGRTGDILKIYDRKLGKFVDPPEFMLHHHELDKDKLLSEESKKKILREIRQPLKEIKELPKTQKLKGYRPNFKGKFSPQNTPDVTASKQSDDIVSGKNASRQVWTGKDKYWKGYETTERMNVIYDNLGHGSQYFDRIVGENVRQKNKKSREVQEHLNMLAHQKAMREVYGIKEYEQIIDESETFDNKINDPLFTKVAKSLKKKIDYPKKPAAKGYPNEAPPKIDPNTGMHPKFGKKYKYDKLDPISAKTMAGAPTGDPEIDANVKKAAKIKEDWRSDLKNLWLGSERKEWKKKIEEDYVNTTQGMKVGQTFTHVPSGETVTTSGVLGGIETLQTNIPIFGDEIPGPDASQYGLQGFAKPIDMMRRGKKKTEQLNKELDSSEEYTKKVKADEFMKARVTGELSLEQKKEFVEIYKNSMEEYDKKSVAIANENRKRIKSNISKVKSFVGKYGQKLSDSYPSGSSDVRIAQGGKTLLVISHSGFNYDDSKQFNVRVYEAMKGKRIKKISGDFGSFEGSIADNPFNKRRSKGKATFMYKDVGNEVENKTFSIKEVPPALMPTPPKFMQKNMDKGWQPSATSSFDQEFINKMNSWFNTIPTGGANFPAQLAINLAKGNLDPVTKSPGPAITNLIKQNILANLKQGFSKSDKLGTNSYWDSKSGKGAIRYDMYKFGDSIQAAKMAPVSASLGQYSIERTDKGIRIVDTYDISGGFTSPGGAAIFDPLTKLIGGRDVQSTGETLTAIAARRAAELGYDMVDADTGKTLQPVYSGEEEYNSRTAGRYVIGKDGEKVWQSDPNAPVIATPKGFNIKIDFTIPWDSFSPETATQLKIGGKQIVNPLSTIKEPSKAVQKIKSMSKTKRQSLSLDEPIVKRKKKKS